MSKLHYPLKMKVEDQRLTIPTDRQDGFPCYFREFAWVPKESRMIDTIRGVLYLTFDRDDVFRAVFYGSCPHSFVTFNFELPGSSRSYYYDGEGNCAQDAVEEVVKRANALHHNIFISAIYCVEASRLGDYLDTKE